MLHDHRLTNNRTEPVGTSLPRFSFIIPVFGTHFHVARLMDQLGNQTCKEFEAIVVCDGKDDDMRDIVTAHTDYHVRYFEVPHRGLRGGHHSVNFALPHCKGEFITVLNGDNVIYPEYVEKMYHPEADIVTCFVLMNDLGGRPLTSGLSFERNWVDRLNYTIRASYAKNIPHQMAIDADWMWLHDCIEAGATRFHHVLELLAEHN